MLNRFSALGEPQFVEFGLPVVLDGSCGVAECCGVAARITVLSDTVTWDDLQSLNTTYPMHFEFVRAEYEAQLRDLPSVPVIDWVQTDDSAY